MKPKLFIKTMGCQMNEYDSEKMADVLRVSHGYEITQVPEEADLLLVNTCSIREKAQEKVFSELGRSFTKTVRTTLNKIFEYLILNYVVLGSPCSALTRAGSPRVALLIRIS